MIRLVDGTMFSMAVEAPKNGVSHCVLRFNKQGMESNTAFRVSAEDLHKIRDSFEAFAMMLEDPLMTGEETREPLGHAPKLKCLPGGKET